MRIFLLLAAAAAEAPAEVDGGWAAWLQTYGGWGVSVCLGIAVIAMARYIVSKLESKADPKEVREVQAIKDKEMYARLHASLFDKLHDTLVPLIAGLEASTTASTELKEEARQLFDDAIKKKDGIITELARQKDQVGSEAMAKMEELYGQMLGLMERVIGAAESLGQVEKRLREQGGGTPAGTGA